jgi:hypothetical protein
VTHRMPFIKHFFEFFEFTIYSHPAERVLHAIKKLTFISKNVLDKRHSASTQDCNGAFHVLVTDLQHYIKIDDCTKLTPNDFHENLLKLEKLPRT